MRLLQVKVSKKELEQIQTSKQYDLQVLDNLETIFQTDENGELIEDPDYKDIFLVRKFDGILFIPCRSKFPYTITKAIPYSLSMPISADENGHSAQVVKYTIGTEISKEELIHAEIVEF